MNETKICKVQQFNFLGLNISDTLTWKSHTNKTSNKISQIIGILARFKKTINKNALLLLYNSLILPHLIYCITLWGKNNQRLIKLQKKAIRTITNVKYNAHTDPIFKQHNLLKLTDLFTLNCLKMYMKQVQHCVPDYFATFTTYRSNTHTYNTLTLSFNTPRTKTISATHRLRFYIVNELENLHIDIKNKLYTHSLEGFTKYFKNYIIGKYSNQCNIPNCYICK